MWSILYFGCNVDQRDPINSLQSLQRLSSVFHQLNVLKVIALALVFEFSSSLRLVTRLVVELVSVYSILVTW